ncbi:Hypothetical protein, putative [Bodo saltans]|uniref:Uncharacterized protein n=1 Tax=Bodo saltans TaxID=75058 RepID=A0A0S4KL55_BODSA|nr:Hypothetical protein, putative [Bodo saltans]|eukprot:CUI15339.1 Hypothetical protein, putative [Bodo saltans]
MRNSILSRPLRPPSRINDESSETQLQRDERLLRARRERAAIIDENMRKLHLADKADIETKLKLFEENKNCFEEHQQFSAEAEAAKRAYEEKLRVEVHDREQQELARAANSNERKKAEARSFMEENKRLAEEKHKRQLEEKTRDQSLDRENNAVQSIAFSQRRLR